MNPSAEKLKKNLGRQLTVMLIPHSDSRPIRLNFSVTFLVILALAWTGLTVWSGFIASRHVDYWRARTDEHVMQAKVWYLSQEMKRSREYLDRVRETEITLQNLLNMKTRKAIVQSDQAAMGGPTRADEKQISGVLIGRRSSFNIDEMNNQLKEVKENGSEVMANFQEISKYIKDQHAEYRSTPMDWPTVGRVTSTFGQRKDPFGDADGEFHKGLDIAAKLGTPVRATADGVVKIASWQGGYGRLVVIDHGKGFRTFYGHNSQLAVKPGDTVKRGQIIAYMGTSGHSTGYHLHYEIWKNGQAVNPMKFVKSNDD